MLSTGKDCFSSPSSCSSTCVKLYLCSNPEDSVVERRALRENVFPRFREHCRHSLELDVRVIDPFESSDPRHWPDENTRQQLIEQCRESSAGPFLLALIGHRYGTAGLPTQVEVSEYQLLLQESQQEGVCTRRLEGAYQRDENTVPPSYCLRPQAEVTKEGCSNTKYEEELRRVFQTAVSLCVHNKVMTPDRGRVLCRSALDADLRFALEKCPVGRISSGCVVYVHKVINANEDRGETQFKILDPPSPTQNDLLSDLCDQFLPALVSSSQLLLYNTTTECDRRHGYTTVRRRSYTESLCQQVFADLVMLTENLNTSLLGGDTRTGEALCWERSEQTCNSLSGFYDIILPEEDKIKAFVLQRKHRCPLVVTGGPCTGKSVLAAHCAQQIKSWLSDSDPVVISYFCSLSVNTTPEHLLSSMCSQIAHRYGVQSLSKNGPNFCFTGPAENKTSSCSTSVLDSHHNHDGDLNLCTKSGPKIPHYDITTVRLSELEQHLECLLSLLPSTKCPLVLILDGLDQLEDDVAARIIRSLPSPLPDEVQLIITASSNCTHFLQSIESHYSEGRASVAKKSGFVCIQLESVNRKQCGKLMESLLKTSRRRVTSGQQALVNQALTSCCLPLYARLLHAHASLWRSDSDVTESSLPDGVHLSISSLLDHLELKHGSFVACAASYLTLSRTGLSEAELADLLFCDDCLLDVSPAEGHASKLKVTQVDVERLLLDLKHFLIKRTILNMEVLLWVSRHFGLVIKKKYLGTSEIRTRIHSKMADYFGDRWSCWDRKQPSSSGPKHPSSDNVRRVDMRTLLELPHHLLQSGRSAEFEHGLLMSSSFHQAMVQTGLLGDLVSMLEAGGGSSKMFLRERMLLISILKSCACFLQSSPLHLPTVMETSLLPYLEVFPHLEGYINDIRQERRQTRRGLGLVVCPSPCSVPPIRYSGYEVEANMVCVTEAAGNECGVVAEVMDDGSAWIRKGSCFDLAQLSLGPEQKELMFTGVKSSGQFLLLSTQSNRLFAWDVAGPERLLEINNPLRTESQLSQTVNRVTGFVAWRKKLCMWGNGETFVSVFDLSTETVTRFQCSSSVTCLVCPFNGSCLYCGQEDGTVSMFNMKTNSLLSTCSNSNCSAVTLIILHDEKQEMACIDRTGSIALWDVADNIQTPKLIKETFNPDDLYDILNSDYSGDICSLLLCQPHKVTLWDTCDWELWDQFLASEGRAFTQAVLSMDGHFFLALLDGCTFVLVWRISTGECVISLETNTPPHMLLKLGSDIIYISQNGCLTTWDAEMIHAVGSAPKMRSGVTGVVVEESRQQFYSTDGSENVWRWSLATGIPDVNFKHCGSVEKLQLSPNGVHLVSLSVGEIYIWRTKTRQNILRISNSRAADILITPNSNFGVSMSKQGLSHVWKVAHGAIVCSIHQYLADAQVSPESTFLIGLCCGGLLAASLWSGLISKRFTCVENSESVVAFHTLSEHPDFVVVMIASGAVYTWKLSEETVCRHFHLPNMFYCQPQNFQMSSDGSCALISTENDSINVLDLSRVRLCSFKAEGSVIKACMDNTGCYVAYISSPDNSCTCYRHAKLILTVARLSDGEKIGSVQLHSKPLLLFVSEQQTVFVGFEDGSVGVYAVSGVTVGEEEFIRERKSLEDHLEKCPFDREPLSLFCQDKPNITWP
ncbi:NACHT and WD repeat domain-containing protein 2 isoform X2 [Nothobranchius furzeri]|uniref:NACHT and WD repeat domain-containing protein 2 isoform X2 n=1 Tax=Nothobranchius furzeri TaxID=105023 RepID=UPI0024043078|nr:NACHT and WD repeat domain-containing protein 2 isoform X2 [Nothobranchius furzeri]